MERRSKGKRSKTPIDPGPGRRLAKEIAIHGRDQKVVAKAASLSEGSLSQLVNGITRGRMSTWFRLSQVLGSSVDFLLTGRPAGAKRGTYESLVAHLFEVLGVDRMDYLGTLSPQEIRALIDRHRLDRLPRSPRRRHLKRIKPPETD